MKTLAFLAKESIFAKTPYERKLARESLRDKVLVYRHSPRKIISTDTSSWRLDNLLKSLTTHAAGLSALSSTLTTGFNINNAAVNLTGAVYSPVSTSTRITKSYSLGTTTGNGLSGGADEPFSFQQGIVAGGSATLDLTAMTNLVLQTSVNIVRIKGYQFRLLSASDDSTISPAPVSTSTCAVTNFGPAVPNQLDFGNGGSGLTLNITVSGSVVNTATINAAGSGYPPSATFLVNVNQVGGAGAALAVTTNASGVPTGSVVVANGGNGYSGASGLATTVIGQYLLATGGAHMYFDPTASGFAAVSSTSKNVRFYNLDASNPVTLEIDIIGATS